MKILTQIGGLAEPQGNMESQGVISLCPIVAVILILVNNNVLNPKGLEPCSQYKTARRD